MSNRSVYIGPRLFLILLTILLAAWSTASNASKIYNWVDEDGVVHYSDTRPEDEASVTTVHLRDLNPEGYDPVTDPYSILNQAKRMNESWTERVAAHQQARSRSEEARKEGLYASLSRAPFTYYPANRYYPVVLPLRERRLNPRAARQQLDALNTFDLAGRRSESINSGVHRERVLRSRALPLVSPNRGLGFANSP